MRFDPDKITWPREQEIARQAEDLALAHFPTGRVDPEHLITQIGIPFTYAPFPEDFDAMIAHDSGRFFIIVNNRLYARGTARSRFTLAHEIGHYHLHRDILARGEWPTHYSRTEYSSESILEREADHFAANLLLPESSFRQMAAGHSPGLQQISALAEFFGASLSATAFRALSLEFFPGPAAVFRWNQLGQYAGGRLSTETALLGKEYCAMPKVAPPGSITARAIAELKVGMAEAPVPAMDWFANLSGYGLNDQIFLREEVISLGLFGWLSLLWNPRHRD